MMVSQSVSSRRRRKVLRISYIGVAGPCCFCTTEYVTEGNEMSYGPMSGKNSFMSFRGCTRWVEVDISREAEVDSGEFIV